MTRRDRIFRSILGVTVTGFVVALLVLSLAPPTPSFPPANEPLVVEPPTPKSPLVALPASSDPGENGFAAAARQLLAEPASVDRDRALAALISDWIKTRPEGLRGFLDTLDVEDELGGEFFAALSGALPSLSDAAASSPYLSEMISQLVTARAAEEPREALAWAETWLLDDALEKARVTVAGVLAAEQPEEALQVLAKISNPLRRVQALGAIGEGYAESDPAAARTWAESLPVDAEVAVAMNGVLGVLAESDPGEASRMFDVVQNRIAGKYAQNLAANRRARGLPENPPLDAHGNPIIEDAGGEEAIPLESPDLDLLAEASGSIARGLAASSPAEALEWTASLPAVLQRDANRAALSAWAETEPEAAYRHCVTHGVTDAETFSEVFASWAEHSPEVAATTAASVAGDRLREQAISGAVGAWAGGSEQAGAIADWISRLPRASDRNVANRALAAAVDADQPQLAWERVMQISDPDDRRGVLSSAFASLAADQPRLAAAALNQAGNLTSDERKLLSRMLDPSGR